jgi:hypothetical protein
MGWGSGNWIALFSLHALTIRITDVWVFAEACGSAFTFQAFLGYLWDSVDQVWKWSVASGHAVHLGTAFFRVHFAITGAFDFRFHRGGQKFFHFWGIAVGSWNADTFVVLQVSFTAEASNDAVLGAHRAWMWIGAGGWASCTACAEHFIGFAFWDWWHHHQ